MSGRHQDPATHLDRLRSPVGTESGDRGRERVGEGVPTTRLLRLPLRQLWRDGRVREQTWDGAQPSHESLWWVPLRGF